MSVHPVAEGHDGCDLLDFGIFGGRTGVEGYGAADCARGFEDFGEEGVLGGGLGGAAAGDAVDGAWFGDDAADPGNAEEGCFGVLGSHRGGV